MKDCNLCFYIPPHGAHCYSCLKEQLIIAEKALELTSKDLYVLGTPLGLFKYLCNTKLTIDDYIDKAKSEVKR
jgi:hypothetical protein